ncbi:stemmadenine O-acetyltransferase-like [Euphorbia lathyris]|uniref:stemmadenine O-acetyltransferase-like n=1 Tax=Euphorbia lathyris TaxID=212925 RepID=UPI0033134064
MGIEVEFISKELIKPSSPTPQHLRKLQFSSIDQNQYPVSIPIILFYPKSNIPNLQRSQLLKQSLSKSLTIFYPLAGRIKNYSYANCNDQGALFIETKANCQLSDILQNRNQYHNYSKKFIPLQPEKGVYQYGSLFQITYFKCGGLALSFAMPHMLGDASSELTFLNCWAAVARGNDVEAPPFVSDSIFPPKIISGFDLSQWVFKEKVVTKPFVFDALTISALRDKYSTNGEKLSRVQALSAFIASRIMAATNNTKSMVLNSVNVRQRLNPPIPEQSFGNLVWIAAAVIDTDDDREGECCYEIGRRIKDSIRGVNAETLEELKKGELHFSMEAFMECLKGGMARYSFSSWCHFPIYEVDFGWGMPEWVTTSSVFIDNVVTFLDTKQGQGIEAWVNMTEDDMAKFENDKHLLSHLSSTSNGIET